MVDAAENTDAEKTGEFYRLEFYKERAEIAVEMAKIMHARTLNGNRLIPIEAFDKDKESKDILGNSSTMGFARKGSKLHNGYEVEILKNGVPFEEIAKDANALHIIDKKEVDQWAIQITAPANLGRDGIVAAFGQSFGKSLTKDNFKRTKGGVEDGVPLHQITVNLGTLIKAPELSLATTQDGNLVMIDAQKLALEAAAARAAKKILSIGGRGGEGDEGGRGSR